MSKEIVISATPHETRVALLEEGQLCEIYVEREKEFALVGSIYKGRVTRVLPGMQSAFVDIGLDTDAFLYVSDFLEDIEEYDQVVSTVEEKVQRMEEQGGQVFSTPESGQSAIEPTDVAGDSPSTENVASPTVGPGSERPGPAVSEPSRNASRGDQGYGQGYHRGRRGRNRRGGRGSDRWHGRELPASKFASHYSRPYGSGGEAAGVQTGDNVPIILPGESLAKYKGRIPQVPPAESAPEAPLEGASDVETGASAERIPAVFAGSSGSANGLEPLPGESIARARSTSEDKQPPQVASAPLAPQPDTAEGERKPSLEKEADSPPGFGEPAEELPVGELSEEEANALAEQVAEAKLEEEAAETAIPRAAEWEEGAASREELGAAAVPETAQEFSENEQDLESPEAGPANEEGSETTTPIEPLAEEGTQESQTEAETPPTTARVESRFRAHLHQPARRGRDRGRREDRGRPPRRVHPHAAPRRRQQISELLKAGQEIIVQIAKEPLGKKGARITSHIALPGRYLVYMPTLDHTGVSRKIASAEERARLRQLVNEARNGASGGFIVRTAAERASAEEIRNDVEFLTRTWNDIRARSEQRKAPTLLHRDLNLVERILRDYLNPEFSAIWVDSEDEYTKVVDFVSRFQPQLSDRVKLYSKESPIFEELGIQQEIDKGLRPKVWLKSGGYIVINHTEALVAIDVNTGKFVGKGSTRLEDTIVRTNLEAVKEIVRQMRLRDLGGIIVIDFIDMAERRNREKVMAALDEALRADRAPSKVLRFNEFGLVAITRKRTKQALERTLCQPCPYCTGSGMVKSIPTLCYEIQAEARKMAPEVEGNTLTLRVHPEIGKALKTRESALVEELERWTKKGIIIQADPTLHWEQYDIY